MADNIIPESRDVNIDLDLDHKPPVYADAVHAPETSLNEENPPSYESLYRKLKRAKEESSNPVEYMQSAFTIICSSFLITIFFAFSVAIPITMVIIGSVFKENCPINSKIPIWLIVTGVFGCTSAVFHTVTNCYVLFKRRKEPNYEAGKKSCISSVIEIFLFAWFICGNVWVYSVSSIVQHTDSVNTKTYCDETCYKFAFWMITVSWILLGVACCCCCCLLLIAGCGLSIATMFGKK